LKYFDRSTKNGDATMYKIIIWAFALGVSTLGSAPFVPPEPPPTQQELTLHPGDKITWTPAAPHRVRFGGSITFNNAPLSLTPFSDVSKVLKDFNPPLTADAQGMAVAPTGTKVMATVSETAATSGISGFFFTCGFPPHSPGMVTVDFKIEPAPSGGQPRDVQIISSPNGPVRWLLKTADGNKNLTRTAGSVKPNNKPASEPH
jgi:hypothetical protein